LIENLPEAAAPMTAEGDVVVDSEGNANANANSSTPMIRRRQTATTSLYQLQATQFGLAKEDDQPTQKNISDSHKEIKTTIMICAIMPSENDVDTYAEVSELAYKKKQAQALIIYHLHKFVAAIHASLCFVEPKAPTTTPVMPSSQLPSPSKESQQQQQQQPPRPSSAALMMVAQPLVNHNKLTQLWHNLALDQTVWETARRKCWSSKETMRMRMRMRMISPVLLE
jgi:hypothetical protein